MQPVKLNDELLQEAKTYAALYSRSVPKQIEYWSRIGKMAEENPDLTFEFIKEIMLARAEAQIVPPTPYHFG